MLLLRILLLSLASITTIFSADYPIMSFSPGQHNHRSHLQQSYPEIMHQKLQNYGMHPEMQSAFRSADRLLYRGNIQALREMHRQLTSWRSMASFRAAQNQEQARYIQKLLESPIANLFEELGKSSAQNVRQVLQKIYEATQSPVVRLEANLLANTKVVGIMHDPEFEVNLTGDQGVDLILVTRSSQEFINTEIEQVVKSRYSELALEEATAAVMTHLETVDSSIRGHLIVQYVTALIDGVIDIEMSTPHINYLVNRICTLVVDYVIKPIAYYNFRSDVEFSNYCIVKAAEVADFATHLEDKLVHVRPQDVARVAGGITGEYIQLLIAGKLAGTAIAFTGKAAKFTIEKGIRTYRSLRGLSSEGHLVLQQLTAATKFRCKTQGAYNFVKNGTFEMAIADSQQLKKIGLESKVYKAPSTGHPIMEIFLSKGMSSKDKWILNYAEHGSSLPKLGKDRCDIRYFAPEVTDRKANIHKVETTAYPAITSQLETLPDINPQDLASAATDMTLTTPSIVINISPEADAKIQDRLAQLTPQEKHTLDDLSLSVGIILEQMHQEGALLSEKQTTFIEHMHTIRSILSKVASEDVPYICHRIATRYVQRISNPSEIIKDQARGVYAVCKFFCDMYVGPYYMSESQKLEHWKQTLQICIDTIDGLKSLTAEQISDLTGVIGADMITCWGFAKTINYLQKIGVASRCAKELNRVVTTLERQLVCGSEHAITTEGIVLKYPKDFSKESLILESSGHKVGSSQKYSYINGVYKDAPYHTSRSSGIKSARPSDGQYALDNSLKVSNNSSRRIAVSHGEIVILDETVAGEFHGHIRSWADLRQDMKNVLVKNNLAKLNGKIIK